MDRLIIGCGYLGHRVALAWMADGYKVAALTRSATKGAEWSRAGIHPVIGDICEPTTLASLPAAETVLFAVGYDRSSGRSQQAVYVDGLNNVLRVLAGRTRRFIYISSSSVYGQSAGEWVDEMSECQPVQSGGKCCLAAEQLVQTHFPPGLTTGSANVLRLSGIYGPGRLLSRVEALRAGETLSGRGDAWLNLIHVDDAVRAVLACERRGQPGQTYLVTDDRPIRRAEYYGRLAELADCPPPGFNPDAQPGRGSGGINKRCRNSRLRDELQVELQFPTINEGLPHSLAAAVAGPTIPIG
ncbi:MAG: SDR family oxidoreductase [Planctomycetes bacterium]|nr:SDR family oxidoreductase [Planctomycetota bacterium]